MKGVMRFGKRGKLSQKYMGPYEILDRVGEVAYRLALPPALARVYNVCVSYIVAEEVLPKEILDTKVRNARESSMVKVLWYNHEVGGANWETEASMRKKYPHLFRENETHIGVGFITWLA
ncbi:uncharacterized protein LOC141631532 [Silene latifolia]|uniref:uncharacterized protein LOC141631532 n=1 Tax=Silene latifolia TaxID=37657 RepID=UPI003D7849C4